MKKLAVCLLMPALACAANSAAAPAARPAQVSRVERPSAAKQLVPHVAGRVVHESGGDRYQWPGVYFDAAFRGPKLYFRVGTGDVILRVLVDREPVATLAKPAPGYYEIGNLAGKQHTVRIEVLTESQAASNVFGGFLFAKGTQGLTSQPNPRQIEFIGDSHTVGYGNTSTTRDCSTDDVWKTTDNSQAFGPKVARHYEADYQVNAISGRGVVRNYGGFAADPLPVAYPFTLLDHAARYDSDAWHPQIIVIALGTNDFSTALNPGEKWQTREALHADFESTYLHFLGELRAKNPQAFIVVWATDMAEGEIEAEAGKVVKQFQSAGDPRIAFMPVHGLTMTGCHWHPSLADDDTIAKMLMNVIDNQPSPWARP